MTENYKIDILKDYKKEFKTHLELKNNHRIIFSGIFGSGKTTFLNDFFKEEDISKQYEVIHLYPVNYSVASNEDIFKLIKFDIFLQLLGKTTNFRKEHFSQKLTAQQFAKENYQEILIPFLHFIPSIGKSLHNVASKLVELRKKYDKYHKDIQINEKQDVIDFIDDITKKSTTIYETDFYTELIISLIDGLKTDNKEIIFVLDDLDRIDPEHIFRLLNVFAAHVDVEGKGEHDNKFGFDKVIFVCDINNIKSIYKHKYGIDTDFNGYIDKFSSNQIFYFEIGKIVEAYLEQILKKVKSDDTEFLVSHLSKDVIHFRDHLITIISTMLINGTLSLRKLINSCTQSQFNPPTYKIVDNVFNYQDYTTQLFDFMLYIFGGYFDDLINSIRMCKSLNKYVNSEETNILCYLTVIDIENHRFKKGNYNFQHPDLKSLITYQMYTRKGHGDFNIYTAHLAFNKKQGNYITDEKIINSKLNHFDLMERAFKKIYEIKNAPIPKY